jgi:uncharacterized protein YllA (UPF0747 family)
LTEEQKSNIVAKLEETSTHLDKIDAEVAALVKHIDYPQTNAVIQGHLAGLIKEALTILNTKKPAPAKKEEPKKEDSDDVAATPTETP